MFDKIRSVRMMMEGSTLTRSVTSPSRDASGTATPAEAGRRRAARVTVEPLRLDQHPVPVTALPRVDGGFATIYADPPWRFTNRTGKVAPEHRRLDRYDTMTLEELRALPVRGACANNGHSYLWVPYALLPDGLLVMQAWGFR